MKKTFTRVLSLVLVLTMFLSALPMTMADDVDYDTFEITCPAEGIDNGYFDVPIGSTVTLTGTGTPSNANEALTWTSSNPSAMTVEGNKLTVVGIGVSVIRVSDSDGNELDNSAFRGKYFPAAAAETLSVVKGATAALPAVTVPGLEAADYDVVWSITAGGDFATVNGTTVTGVAAGTATATAVITSPAYGGELAYNTLTCTITVTDVVTYTPVLDKTAVELYVGEETAKPVIDGLSALTEGSDKDYTVTWVSSADSIAKIEDGKIKALAEGTATLTATVTLLSDKAVFAGNVKTALLTCTVTVKDGVVLEVAEPIAITTDGTYALKAPTLKGSNLDGLKITSYKYELVTGKNVSTELKTVAGTYILYGKAVGRDTLVLTATVKTNNGNGSTITVPALEIPVSVYAKAETITVMLKDNVKTFHFNETGVMNSLKIGDTNVLADYPALDQLIRDLTAANSADRSTSAAAYTLKFASIEVEGGKLDNDKEISPVVRGVGLDRLYGVFFTKDEKNPVKATFTYTIFDDKNLPAVVGELHIDYQGTAQVKYATSFSTPVTFEEEDFEKFWTQYGTGEKLNYIKFTSLPSTTYGKLWTDTNKTTAVTTSMAFIADYYGSTSYYDLDTVTFVPGSKTTAYTVSIPFKAYDMKGSAVQGTISISVTKGTTSNVSSLGMAFGNASYKLDDKIAEAFKTANPDDTLDYVTFTIPAAMYGKLYYNFTDLMTAETIYASNKFHYNPETGEKVDNLAKVAFIPAAGYKGPVKIDYQATGENGATYNGFVTLNVTAKSESTYFKDVKTGSYNWASDSVDFLRYHGIVNGTNDANDQFSPANSITRAHFMLMLYRAFLADSYKNFNVTSNFSDIPKGTSAYQKELYQAVGVAKYLGITNGVDGKYLPNKNISREEAMTLIYRTLSILNINLKYTSANRTSDFADYSKVSTYAKDPLKYLIEHGVVLGTDGKINPKSNITRAEMAVILHRVLTY